MTRDRPSRKPSSRTGDGDANCIVRQAKVKAKTDGKLITIGNYTAFTSAYRPFRWSALNDASHPLCYHRLLPEGSDSYATAWTAFAALSALVTITMLIAGPMINQTGGSDLPGT